MQVCKGTKELHVVAPMFLSAPEMTRMLSSGKCKVQQLLYEHRNPVIPILHFVPETPNTFASMTRGCNLLYKNVYFLDKPFSHLGILRLPPLSLFCDWVGATGAGAGALLSPSSSSRGA